LSHFFCNVATNVEHVHAMAALIAATIHDLDHPGFGNSYLINANHHLAILYNDVSVLENHHAALAFHMMLNDPSLNICAALSRDEYRTLRLAVVDFVLATDMRRHFEYLAKFQQNIIGSNATPRQDMSDDDSPACTPRDASMSANDHSVQSMVTCRMLIKCADICNPARPWRLCREWAFRIVEEYFRQTADERSRALPLTMETFDRDTCNVPRTQCGFIDMFAREMFTSWTEFTNMSHLNDQLNDNYVRWQQECNVWSPSWNYNFGVTRKSV